MHRLEKLWALIEPHVRRFGAFRQGPDGVVSAEQSGVLRVNCIDCLDRTNVVQGWLARRQLDLLLADLQLLPAGSSIKEAFPEVCLIRPHVASACCCCSCSHNVLLTRLAGPEGIACRCRSGALQFAGNACNTIITICHEVKLLKQRDHFEQVEAKFKWIWADQGDDISRQYAGTGALKSGFTRTGPASSAAA